MMPYIRIMAKVCATVAFDTLAFAVGTVGIDRWLGRYYLTTRVGGVRLSYTGPERPSARRLRLVLLPRRR